MKHLTLASFAAERRMAAIAHFQGTQLGKTTLKHIGDDAKAVDAAREMASRSFEKMRPDMVAVCVPNEKASERLRGCCAAVTEVARELGIPVTEIDDATLMAAYASPPLIRKEHVRRIGRNIWPGLNEARARHVAIDAATAGLYVQTERLFQLSEETI